MMMWNTPNPADLSANLNAAVAAGDAVLLLEQAVTWLRLGGANGAARQARQLYAVLAAQPELASAAGTLLARWLGSLRVYPTLITFGIFARQGFGHEMHHRLYERWMPAYKDRHDLRDILRLLLGRNRDGQWLAAVPPHLWWRLGRLLQQHADAAQMANCQRHLRHEALYAVEMLSVWIAAEALEPDFIRLEPKLLDVDSPLVGLKREVALWLEHQRNEQDFDPAHLQVMLAQCRSLVERLRRKGTGAGAGSSMRVAHLLERLMQSLARLEDLMHTCDAPTTRQRRHGAVQLADKIAKAATEQRAILPLWRGSVKMLARSISQNSSRHGEHYITRTRKEYFAMLRSAAGGGVLIALMALFKIHLGNTIDDPFWQSVAASLNYGIGFVIIHMLHCTVATKQPAMTAASFAQAVERNEKGRAVDTKLAQLLIDVCRSQGVAVFGNVFVAVMLAATIAWLYAASTGQPLLDEAAAAYQLKSLDIFGQPTLWFAAIAGVWLFCAGIIAGFFDNRADYLNLKMRLREHPWLKRLLPQSLREKLADYIHKHYGAIMGNFCFGILLGMTGYLGHLTGLPLDIRHVAFSSANLGYAAASSGLSPLWFILCLLAALAIGLVNLLVSFSITLWVALRSRDAVVSSPKNIFKTLRGLLKQKPRQLFFPPNDSEPEKANDNKSAPSS